MPSQLLNRLSRCLDQRPADNVLNPLEAVARVNNPALPAPPQTQANPPQQNTNPHWPGGFGVRLTNVQSVVIHETSGWPSYASSDNFENRYRCLHLQFEWKPPVPPKPPKPGKPGHWADDRGIGPQYFVDPNGTAFTLIGPHNLAGAPRQTWHTIGLNDMSLGIENATTGDSTVTPGTGMGPNWWQMSTDAEDLTGMKLYLVLHPDGDEDAVLVWLAQFQQRWSGSNWVARAGAGPPFRGSGDIDDGDLPPTHPRRLSRHQEWKNMLLTERDYRTLALLCRLLAEQNGLPRNFPLLPYLEIEHGDDADAAAMLRQLILADQTRDAIALKIGITTADIETNGAAYTNFYSTQGSRAWSRFFGFDPQQAGVVDTPCFKGFLSHAIIGHHPCPGPLFDWHRLAREVWDWWWYPFDTDAVAVTTTRRPYSQARRTTQLIDYYYDSTGAATDYNRLRPHLAVYERFVLPQTTPVYAMANGVVVAARFALSNDPASTGFLLVRHELFHQTGVTPRIDYDVAPTFVWSLITFLENAGFAIPAAPPAAPPATSDANPDWLNRFIMRLRECELAVQFHSAHPGDAALARGWAHNPSATAALVPRATTGQQIERDAAAYRALADDLRLGRPVLFPLEGGFAETPVRVILGDFLGFANVMAQNQNGIQVEIFSRDRLPVPGAVQRPPSASDDEWWRNAAEAVRHEATAAMDLPLPSGPPWVGNAVWQYPMTDFLDWANTNTWQSEWTKYGVAGQGGAPAPAPARPLTRRVT
jgi:hypothetical protein